MSDHVCKLGPPPEEVAVGADEPTFGLTPDEKQVIIASWNLVKLDLPGNATNILLTFFKDYPHNLQYFAFKNIPIAELGTEPALQAHAMRVLSELSSCIDNINKPKTVLHALQQNALNHRKRQIPKESYDEVRLSIIKVISEVVKIGKNVFAAEAEATWDKALRVILAVITDAQTGCVCG